MLMMRVTPKISDSPAPTRNRLDAAASPLSAWKRTASRLIPWPPHLAPLAPPFPLRGEVTAPAAAAVDLLNLRGMFSSRAACSVHLSPAGRGRERSERVRGAASQV